MTPANGSTPPNRKSIILPATRASECGLECIRGSYATRRQIKSTRSGPCDTSSQLAIKLSTPRTGATMAGTGKWVVQTLGDPVQRYASLGQLSGKGFESVRDSLGRHRGL